MIRRALLAIALVAGIAAPAWAHKPSDAQLHLTADGNHLSGRLDVSLRDLDAALGIDRDGNGDITWTEVQAAAPAITAYVRERFTVVADGTPCTAATGTPALVDLIDGAYSAVPLDLTCPAGPPHAIAVKYALLYDLDAQHRGILHIDDQLVIARDATPIKLTLGLQRSHTPAVLAGAAAVGGGIAHWAIVLALVLPIALWRRRSGVQVARALDRLAVFVIAQLAVVAGVAAGLVALPAIVVAIAVAVTVVAVIGNAVLGLGELRGSVAVELGALHGFALGAALTRLGPPGALPLGTVAGFELGALLAYVALGAIAIAASVRVLGRS